MIKRGFLNFIPYYLGPLAGLAALIAPTAPAVAQITAFKHVIVVIQENRTPDNLFHDLCLTHSCSAQPSATQYNIQTNNWFDKTSPTGTFNPVAVSLGENYDPSHKHPAFVSECDKNASGVCRMDGAAQVICSSGTHSCPTNHASFAYVSNENGVLQPYFDIVASYGWGNYFFQTNQGPSYPAHQFLYGATSAPSAADDSIGTFVSENAPPPTGCAVPNATRVPVINSSGVEFGTVVPCFEHHVLSDLLDAQGVSWRYYGSGSAGAASSAGIWIAPASISHVCLAQTGACSGPQMDE